MEFKKELIVDTDGAEDPDFFDDFDEEGDHVITVTNFRVQLAPDE